MKNEIIYNKLVRDRIPEIIEQTGKKFSTYIASEEEYKEKLHNKLLEEANEFISEPSEEELADIMEVVEALINLNGYDMEAIQRIKKDKQEKRGGFYEKIILTKVYEE